MRPTLLPDSITIGVDVGQRQDPSAVVVAEAFEGDHHRIHVVERLALQTAYPQVAERLRAIYIHVVTNLATRIFNENLRAEPYVAPGMRPPAEPEALGKVYVLVDATGCGLPVVDYLRETAGIADGHLTGVMFTAGTGISVNRGARDGTVAKSYLVSRLQSLIGFGRIEWPRTPAADELVDELKTFELSITDNATPQWNARAGHHDDLVCAAALAVLVKGGGFSCGSTRYA